MSNIGPALGNPIRFEDGIWWFSYRHARDIPNQLFLDAMAVASAERARESGWIRPMGAFVWDVTAVLATGHIANSFDDPAPGVPLKVVLAKARRLINRGVITGCACGCRGDFRSIG